MTESVTYRAILRKGRQEGRQEGREEGELAGRVEQARASLLLFGAETLGEPSSAVRAAISEVTELPRLLDLTRRIAHTDSWEELLAE